MAIEKIRTLIVDDEPFARHRIRSLLSLQPDVSVIAECGDGMAAVAALEEYRPDLVFLDVQMPELDGFEVLKALDPNTFPMVIFVTAHDTYALRAFEVHAVDYLLKPFDAERFSDALRQARERIRVRRRDGFASTLTRLMGELGLESTISQRLVVRSAGSIRFLRTDEIDWIESSGNYTSLHVGPRVHLLRETMKGLETRLDPRRFARIHRFAIVNLDRVAELKPLPSGDYEVVLGDGKRLTLSRSHLDRMKRLLG